jgi:CO/xanthine dehydrogenase FAD-binding subunit
VKPAPFEYVAAHSVEEALEALREDGARVLAGGQSLLPLLNARRERATRLVDVNGAGLGVIRRTDGALRLGATVRQAALIRSRLVRDHWPLLARTAGHVGHLATRTRGTVGGSVAHADPRAQLPLALLALDAEYVEKGPLLLEIVVPPPPRGTRSAFAEHARTRGDFPSAAAAVVVGAGHAAVAVLGVGRVERAERALREGAGARDAAELAAQTVDRGHRRALIAEVTRRALVECGR